LPAEKIAALKLRKNIPAILHLHLVTTTIGGQRMAIGSDAADALINQYFKTN
jgi:hypothetical protein